MSYGPGGMNSTPPTKTSVMYLDPDTGEGRYFDFASPRADDVSLSAVAHGLESLVRFHGQTTRPITVAEHCMRVARFARRLAELDQSGPLSDVAYLAGLRHDDHEALVPWGDCLSPGKTESMRVSEAEVSEAILERMTRHVGLSPLMVRAIEDCAGLVHAADKVALYFEAMLWQPGASAWACEVLESTRLDPALVHRELLPLVWPVPHESWFFRLFSSLATCAAIDSAASHVATRLGAG